MPKFEQLEVNPQTVESRLRPSNEGAMALERAANTEREYASINLRNQLRSADMIGAGIREVGGAFKGLEKSQQEAQAHTDAMAELDANKSINDAEIGAITGLTQAASPKDQNGDVIEETPGRGVNAALPLNGTVPTPDQYTESTAKIANGHDEAITGLRESLFGGGHVSQKAQDRINMRIQESQYRIRIHQATLGVENTINHAVHTTDTSLNNSLTYVDQNPDQLETGIAQIKGTISAAQSGLAGDAAIRGRSVFEKAQENALTQAVTMAAEAKARKGDVSGAMDILNRHPGEVGKTREQLQTRINELGNESFLAEERKQAALLRQAKTAGDLYAGQQMSDWHAGMKEPNWEQTPQGKAHPELARQWHEEWKSFEQEKIGQFSVDPVTSNSNLHKAEQEMFSSPSPDAVFEKYRQQLGTTLSFQDLGKLRSLANDPATRDAGKEGMNWLNHIGETKIDPKFGTLPTPGGHTPLGLQQKDAWLNDYMAKVRSMSAAGNGAWRDLLDPSKAGNMVDDKALAKYRVTDQLQSEYDAKQKQLNTAADQFRHPEQADQPTIWQRLFSNQPSPEQITVPIPQDTLLPQKAPETVPDEAAASKLAPGTRFIIPDGKYKGQIGTVPKPQSANEPTTQTADVTGALPNAGEPLGPQGPQGLAAAHTAANQAFPEAQAKMAAQTAPAGVVHAVTDQTQRVRDVRGYGEQLTGAIVVNNHTYHFINGGGGRGSIPFGEYSVRNFRTATQREAQGLHNLGDTFDLSDVRDPLAGGAERQDLRIHAAHGAGTLGCIGILGGETKFRQFANDIRAAGVTKLVLGPHNQTVASNQ